MRVRYQCETATNARPLPMRDRYQCGARIEICTILGSFFSSSVIMFLSQRKLMIEERTGKPIRFE